MMCGCEAQPCGCEKVRLLRTHLRQGLEGGQRMIIRIEVGHDLLYPSSHSLRADSVIAPLSHLWNQQILWQEAQNCFRKICYLSRLVAETPELPHGVRHLCSQHSFKSRIHAMDKRAQRSTADASAIDNSRPLRLLSLGQRWLPDPVYVC
jgi:hypothetical protein